MSKLNSNKNKIILLLSSTAFLFVSVTTYSFYTVKDNLVNQRPFVISTNNVVKPSNANSITESSVISKLNISSLVNNNSSSLSQSTSIQSKVKLDQEPPKNLENPKLIESIEIKVLEKSQMVEQNQRVESQTTKTVEETKVETPKVVTKFKTLEGNQWKELYEKSKLSYPNTKSEYGGLDYFGDPALNKVATDIALQRGFVKRSVVADESQMIYYEGYPIQKLMGDSMSKMFKEMRENGHSIIFLSGHRGIVEQSQVFGQEFTKQSFAILGHEASNEEILNRKADAVISKSLETVALPGYSRHHLGYTIDVTESGTYYKDFEKTGSYEWMSKDNFANLKKYGIIPSYPKGVQDQGPEPESWEFVYVGTDILKE